MTNEEFLHAFETATLPRTEWTHEAHVRMGYLTLRRMALPDAIAYARRRIRCYNEAHGNLTGYHETITVAFLTIIAECISQGGADSWDAFRAAQPDLIEDGVSVLLRRHTRETLFSSEARGGLSLRRRARRVSGRPRFWQICSNRLSG